MGDGFGQNSFDFPDSFRMDKPGVEADTGHVGANFIAQRDKRRIIRIEGVRRRQQRDQPLLNAMKRGGGHGYFPPGPGRIEP